MERIANTPRPQVEPWVFKLEDHYFFVATHTSRNTRAVPVVYYWCTQTKGTPYWQALIHLPILQKNKNFRTSSMSQLQDVGRLILCCCAAAEIQALYDRYGTLGNWEAEEVRAWWYQFALEHNLPTFGEYVRFPEGMDEALEEALQ